MPGKGIQTETQFELSGVVFDVWGGGFLVSLTAAEGCLELVHRGDEHVVNSLSFV